MWKARVFTLYPEIFPGPLNKGLYAKAMEKKLWNLEVINIRDSAEDKHKTVDDTPFGGGSGMLLKPDILGKSIDSNIKKDERISSLIQRAGGLTHYSFLDGAKMYRKFPKKKESNMKESM